MRRSPGSTPSWSSIVTAVLILAACRPAPPRSSANLESPQFLTATGDTIKMAEVLRIGGLDVSDKYLFTRITWTLPTAERGVILFDSGADEDGATIREFDSTGVFVRSIGRFGEGPGEYDRFPMGTLLTDGRLLIASQGQARLTRFDRTGKQAGIWRGPTGIVDLAPAPDGGWWVSYVTSSHADAIRGITYLRYNTNGELIDSVAAPEEYVKGPYGGSYQPRAMTVILPDGRTVAGRTDSLAFTIVGRTGKQRFSHEAPRARFNPDEKKALVAAFRAVLRRGGNAGAPVEISDEKQAYRYMVSDTDGRILLLLHSDAVRIEPEAPLKPNDTPWREKNRIDVYDSAGGYRGRLLGPLGSRGRGFAFTADALWLVQEGESGEEYLVKWRPSRVAW